MWTTQTSVVGLETTRSSTGVLATTSTSAEGSKTTRPSPGDYGQLGHQLKGPRQLGHQLVKSQEPGEQLGSQEVKLPHLKASQFSHI